MTDFRIARPARLDPGTAVAYDSIEYWLRRNGTLVDAAKGYIPVTTGEAPAVFMQWPNGTLLLVEYA